MRSACSTSQALAVHHGGTLGASDRCLIDCLRLMRQPAVSSRSCGSVSRRHPGNTISLLQEWQFRRQR